MTSDELQTMRQARWAELRPGAVSAADLRQWVRRVGFLDAPEAAAWSPVGLELLEQELAGAQIVELTQWPGQHRYGSGDLLRYVYAAVGDRHPRTDYRRQAQQRKLSWVAAEVFDLLLQSETPGTSSQLRDRLGAERTSSLTIEAALRELSSTLKVLRVGRTQEGETCWRPLLQVAPEVPREASGLSLVESAAALASQWLDVNVCATEDEMAAYFAPLFSRSRMHTALSGLEAMRHIELDAIDGRPAYRVRRR